MIHRFSLFRFLVLSFLPHTQIKPQEDTRTQKKQHTSSSLPREEHTQKLSLSETTIQNTITNNMEGGGVTEETEQQVDPEAPKQSQDEPSAQRKEPNKNNEDDSSSSSSSSYATTTKNNTNDTANNNNNIDIDSNNNKNKNRRPSPFDDPRFAGLSKNQRRRLLRREHSMARRQEKKAERRAKAMAQGRDIEAEQRHQAEKAALGEGKRKLNDYWERHKAPLAARAFQIAVDCSFEHLLMEREIASLIQQLRYCYAYNKKARVSCRVGITGLQEKSETLGGLKKEAGFEEWSNRLFVCTEQPLEDYYADQKSQLVYLTSDSTNVLKTLDDTKIYVIGGIVDRNRLKRLAMDRAETLGIETAKLPLDEHLAQKMTSTPVLTCNHVFDILLKTREYGNDWAKALREVLPTRKEPTFKKRGRPPPSDKTGSEQDDRHEQGKKKATGGGKDEPTNKE